MYVLDRFARPHPQNVYLYGLFSKKFIFSIYNDFNYCYYRFQITERST